MCRRVAVRDSQTLVYSGGASTSSSSSNTTSSSALPAPVVVAPPSPAKRPTLLPPPYTTQGVVKSLTELRPADRRNRFRRLLLHPSTSSTSFLSESTESRELQSSGSLFTLQGVEIRKKKCRVPLNGTNDEGVLVSS
eukprot:Protomagalhaensia_wolfi_Nauph_80__943@NODE_1543_length_1479_cov_257_174306_g1198_i0_p1_GENE_NODE_1543_length_1479_cov_257_174306_g1198_i0NODE_1543_length_1479_cov_257_174306_g1198_i0_p1_ORF_typecomplete_len137_score16_76_NODE_1543_length_1479_cov_257_174306_g1198_i047457